MSDSENPYRSPTVQVLDFEPVTPMSYAAPARTVSAGHGSQWIGDAWELFKDAPLMWFAAMLIFFGVSMLLNMVPVLGSIAGILLGPSLMVGVLDFGRGHARQHDADLSRMFSGFGGEKIGSLMIMAVLYLAMIVVIAIAVMIFLAIGLGGAGILGQLTSGMAMKDALAGAGIMMVLGAALVFLLAMMMLVAAYWFAPGLIFFAGLQPVEAMKASFAACMRNWLPFTVYSLLALVLLVVSFIPFGLGLLIFFPLMMATGYTSFEDLFGTE